MPYEYVRLLRFNTIDSPIETHQEDHLLEGGYRVHSEQTIPTGKATGEVATLTLFERYKEEEVIPPEPMRIK